MSHAPADRNWAWDLYWHADRIASCMDGAERGNYDDRLAAGWRAFFESLPEGSRILDLCTGNGAIAAIAADAGTPAGKHFAISGVDLAHIDPPRFVSRYGEAAHAIRFMGGVNCEQLPFEDAAFDAVVSQYGIEYSRLDQSLPEAVRVVAPGGRLRLGMHASDGKVVSAARAMIADADFLLDEVRLYDVAAECLERVACSERESGSEEARHKADKSFAEFQQALAATAEYLPRACDRRMVEHSGSLLTHTFQNRRHFDLPVLLAKVDEVRAQAEAHRARSVAMVEAAVSKDGAAAIARQLTDLGLTAAGLGEQRDEEGLLGYTVEAACAA